MFKKPTAPELAISACIMLWIFVAVMVTVFVIPVPTWPMFFVTIFFFLMGMDKKNLKSIFPSGLVGLIIAYLGVVSIGALAPAIGMSAATALVLFISFAIIIFGGCYCPLVLNNITFAYFTVAYIKAEEIPQNILTWVLVLLIGGGILAAGSLLILSVLTKYFTNKASGGK